MTSRRQRQQPNHHMECYPYPTAIFNDDFYPATDEINPDTDESSIIVSSSLHTESTHQNLLDRDAHIDFHYEDPSAIASSSSGPSLRSKNNQIQRANIIPPSSPDNLSSLVSNYQTEDQPINVSSMIPDQYNIIGQSFYQKKRKRELF